MNRSTIASRQNGEAGLCRPLTLPKGNPMIRRLAALLLCLAGAMPALAQDVFSPAQREALDARIRSYLLENPEVLLEVFEVLERRRQVAEADADAARVAASSAALLNDGYSPVLGNPVGDVTVVKFSDYRCGYCRQAAPIVASLIESDPGVRVVIKEFPILGEESVLAGRVALAAARVNAKAYDKLHEAIFSYRGQFTEASLIGLAEKAGVDGAALRREMAKPEIADSIRATYALARELGVEGTPSFVIGNTVVRGMIQLERMKELVAEARRAKG
jgi:protein-disulfide isomerase